VPSCRIRRWVINIAELDIMVCVSWVIDEVSLPPAEDLPDLLCASVSLV